MVFVLGGYFFCILGWALRVLTFKVGGHLGFFYFRVGT